MKSVAIIAALAACVASIAYARAASPLELAPYLALVEQHNPELIAAGRQRGVAAAEDAIARAYPNPEIDVSAGEWRSRGTGQSGSTQQWALSQRIDLPTVRSARIAVARAGITATDAQIQAVRQDVGFLAMQAYYDAARRATELALALENEQLLTLIMERVRARVDVGEAPRFELSRVRAEALVSHNQAESARLRLDEAHALMRRLAGNRLAPDFEVSGRMPAPAKLQPLPVLQAQMQENHPALRAARAETARANARLRHELALRSPQPTLQVLGSRDPESNQTLFGVSVPLPIWDQRKGQIAQAQSAVNVTAAQSEARRVQLLRELDSAYARQSLAQRLIETFEDGLIAQSENALRIAEAAYRAGERSFLEVLDAQRSLRAARADYIAARFDRVAAQLEIERLLARDPFDLRER